MSGISCILENPSALLPPPLWAHGMGGAPIRGFARRRASPAATAPRLLRGSRAEHLRHIALIRSPSAEHLRHVALIRGPSAARLRHIARLRGPRAEHLRHIPCRRTSRAEHPLHVAPPGDPATMVFCTLNGFPVRLRSWSTSGPRQRGGRLPALDRGPRPRSAHLPQPSRAPRTEARDRCGGCPHEHPNGTRRIGAKASESVDAVAKETPRGLEATRLAGELRAS